MKTMKNLIIIFLGLILAGCSTEIEDDLIITNTNIINVESGEISYNQDVMIIDDSIAQIIESRTSYDFHAGEVIDGNDKYLIPGLWDMHTHTWWGYKDFFPLLLVNCVTGVRQGI